MNLNTYKPCISESLGYGVCEGTLTTRFGLTECDDCGLTPYNDSEGELHDKIMDALDKAQGAAWENAHVGAECTLESSGDFTCVHCDASRTAQNALTERAMAGEIVSAAVCFDCEHVACVCDETRCPDCFEMYRNCICVTFSEFEGCGSDDPSCECMFCVFGA